MKWWAADTPARFCSWRLREEAWEPALWVWTWFPQQGRGAGRWPGLGTEVVEGNSDRWRKKHRRKKRGLNTGSEAKEMVWPMGQPQNSLGRAVNATWDDAMRTEVCQFVQARLRWQVGGGVGEVTLRCWDWEERPLWWGRGRLNNIGIPWW